MTTWTTNDGRVLEIRWMQSQHLVHSFNMVARKNLLTAQRVHELCKENTAGIETLKTMRDELQVRGLYVWARANALSIPSIRETLPQLCMLRALIDTGKAWPGILEFHSAKSYIWHQFESAEQQLRREAISGNADAQAIVAKFTEYRLERA